MNVQESYILFTTLLVLACLGLRQRRRQQMLAYVQHYYGHTMQRLVQQQSSLIAAPVAGKASGPTQPVLLNQEPPALYQLVLASIADGELADVADPQLQLFSWQLHWLSYLPLIILFIGYLLAQAL